MSSKTGEKKKLEGADGREFHTCSATSEILDLSKEDEKRRFEKDIEI